jgi:phosphoribosyl 1,2-cyclic phosphodiesterase
MMIEANYCDEILERNITSGIVHPCMRPRLLKTHMELKTCKGIFKAADLSEVRNIILVHLSSDNSDEEMFVREIQEATGRPVYAACKGLEIDMNLIPY